MGFEIYIMTLFKVHIHIYIYIKPVFLLNMFTAKEVRGKTNSQKSLEHIEFVTLKNKSCVKEHLDSL